MHYIYNPYDVLPCETEEEWARSQAIIEKNRQTIRDLLPQLRKVIEDPQREKEDVSRVLRPYYIETRAVPMTPEDIPELESLCRLILEKGGEQGQKIQEMLLSVISSTAAQESIPFLLDMLHGPQPKGRFGPRWRELALVGLGRIALIHERDEAYEALHEGLEDRHADVRYTTMALIANAYLNAEREIPKAVLVKFHKIARSDPDKDLRQDAKRYLREFEE